MPAIVTGRKKWTICKWLIAGIATVTALLLAGCRRDTPPRPVTPTPDAAAQADAGASTPPETGAPAAPANAAAAVSSSTGTRTSPTRKLALLVGINDYQYDDISDLSGTLNDVEAMRDVLIRRFGFAASDVLVLTDAQAAKAKIERAFRQHLIGQANRDTVAVFYYSGHGSRVFDASGDEPDRLDETIVAYDSGRSPGRPNRDVTDDELNSLLTELGTKTSHIAVVLDSCHSGTAVRAGATPRVVKDDSRAPEAPTAIRVVGTGRAVEGSSGFRSGDPKYVLISGSRSNEYSYERPVQGRTMGALTWFLTRALWQATPDTTYRDIMARVADDVTSAFAAQHPQLEGFERDAVLFGRDRIEPQPFAEVRNRAGRVEVQAGIVQGLSAGAVLAVFAPLTKNFAGPPLAKIELTSVAATTSEAKRLEGAAEIPDGARAIEMKHEFGGLALRVAYEPVDAPELRSVRDALKAYPHIQTAKGPKEYDVLVERTNDKKLMIYGTTDERLSEPAAGADAVSRTVKALVAWAKWFSVRQIENQRSPNGGAPLDVDLRLVGGGTTFVAGQTLKARIRNNSGLPLYLSLVDLSFDGSVSIVYPESGAQETIQPGGVWEKPLVACLPPGRAEPITDIIKVFFTEQPTDLSLLEQKAIVQTRSKAQAPLVELLSTNAFGVTWRRVERPTAPTTVGWATRQVTMTVTPKEGAKPCGASESNQ
jgi:hypothetical protein